MARRLAACRAMAKPRIVTDRQAFPRFRRLAVRPRGRHVLERCARHTDRAGDRRAGVTDVSGKIGELADTTLPLKAMVKISIHEPGGRTTDKTVELPVRTRDVLIGIRPDFDGGSVAENARAGFEAIAVDGERQAHRAVRASPISWVREDTTYQWYPGQWRMEIPVHHARPA